MGFKFYVARGFSVGEQENSTVTENEESAWFGAEGELQE